MMPLEGWGDGGWGRSPPLPSRGQAAHRGPPELAPADRAPRPPSPRADGQVSRIVDPRRTRERLPGYGRALSDSAPRGRFSSRGRLFPSVSRRMEAPSARTSAPGPGSRPSGGRGSRPLRRPSKPIRRRASSSCTTRCGCACSAGGSGSALRTCAPYLHQSPSSPGGSSGAQVLLRDPCPVLRSLPYQAGPSVRTSAPTRQTLRPRGPHGDRSGLGGLPSNLPVREELPSRERLREPWVRRPLRAPALSRSTSPRDRNNDEWRHYAHIAQYGVPRR